MKHFVIAYLALQTLAIGKPIPKVEMLSEEPEIRFPRDQFVSTVQIMIKETDPRIKLRSQKLVMQELSQSLQQRAELQRRPYKLSLAGNEVVFYLVTDNDMRQPMQSAVSQMISQLNGRVRAKGRSHFYRTSLAPNVGGFLEVQVSADHTKIASIAAQTVPLRELLKELRAHLGDLSYLIPGECAGKLVDWSFGNSEIREPKTVDSVMSELAVLFGLRCEKQNGTYIFTGTCSESPNRGNRATSLSAEYLAGQFFPQNPSVARPTQVYFPLVPMGE